MCWKEKVIDLDSNPQQVNPRQALHLADLSIFICKTQMPLATISWVSERIKRDDVYKAHNSAWHVVKLKKMAVTVMHHHHFILGTKRIWAIWVFSAFPGSMEEDPLHQPRPEPRPHTLTHTSLNKAGLTKSCVRRIMGVSDKIIQEGNIRKGSIATFCV